MKRKYIVPASSAIQFNTEHMIAASIQVNDKHSADGKDAWSQKSNIFDYENWLQE